MCVWGAEELNSHITMRLKNGPYTFYQGQPQSTVVTTRYLVRLVGATTSFKIVETR